MFACLPLVLSFEVCTKQWHRVCCRLRSVQNSGTLSVVVSGLFKTVAPCLLSFQVCTKQWHPVCCRFISDSGTPFFAGHWCCFQYLTASRWCRFLHQTTSHSSLPLVSFPVSNNDSQFFANGVVSGMKQRLSFLSYSLVSFSV